MGEKPPGNVGRLLRSGVYFPELTTQVGFMKNIYVGNLNFQTTEDELRNLFGKHGNVERVSLPKDNVTGKPRGFAFVEMPDDVEAERAIRALDGTTLGGRTLKVNEARPRTPEAQAGRGNGERRFGRG